VFGGWSLPSIKFLLHQRSHYATNPLFTFCPGRNGDPQLHWQEVADFKYSFADLRSWSFKKKLPWS